MATGPRRLPSPIEMGQRLRGQEQRRQRSDRASLASAVAHTRRQLPKPTRSTQWANVPRSSPMLPWRATHLDRPRNSWRRYKRNVSTPSGALNGLFLLGLVSLILIYNATTALVARLHPFFSRLSPIVAFAHHHVVESSILSVRAFGVTFMVAGAIAFLLTQNWFRLLLFFGALGMTLGYWVANGGFHK